MNKLSKISLIVSVMFTGNNLLSAKDLSVTKDKQNVVASKLAGSWVIDPNMTLKLTGARKAFGENSSQTITFISDEKVIDLFAKKMKVAEMSKEQKAAQPIIYQAGWMVLGKKKCPYFLLSRRGNPNILFFLEKDGDIFGNGESFNLMLAPAKESKNDLLFIGGDFNNQPFRAYLRSK